MQEEYAGFFAQEADEEELDGTPDEEGTDEEERSDADLDAAEEDEM